MSATAGGALDSPEMRAWRKDIAAYLARVGNHDLAERFLPANEWEAEQTETWDEWAGRVQARTGQPVAAPSAGRAALWGAPPSGWMARG
jgi:hypothetical protein